MIRRILFLNQYFPPDAAPTGALLRELGDSLKETGWEAEYISSGQDYREKKTGSRAVRELRALGAILWRGWRARRADVVFSASSPPGLAFVAALVAIQHRAKAVHWLMDMYPEIAVALGEISDGALAGMVRSMMGWAYRRTGLTVALDDDMAKRLLGYGVKAEVIAPWILQPLLPPVPDVSPDRELLWIYSGNLGRAHEWRTLLEVQAVLEGRGSAWQLLFQGGGPSWPQAQERAVELGLQRCEWKPYAEEAELRKTLARGRALVVTQRPETQGLLWPSKLALLLDMERPILWVGPTNGAIPRSLRAIPGAGIFAPGDVAGISEWLSGIERGEIEGPATGTGKQTREKALGRWAKLLEHLFS